MKTNAPGKRFIVGTLAAAMLILPVAALGQTRITAPKNKYKVQDDVRVGREAAVQVEQKFPVLNDRDAGNYIQSVGSRLVNSIPTQFRQPAFNYQFKWVNARDLNAFALPGGPMYINRGMLEAARNEGELAGVMAHEISHIALRHATAQQTKATSATSTLGTIGLILGGAILGGQTGAQLGMLGAQAWMTKFSREYESQADMLGARIMADAGYDPRDLANVFRTIAGERTGGGTPEFLNSHPNPDNRYEKINREAQLLNVSRNPIKITGDFERIKARFKSMPGARSMAEIEKQGGGGQGQQNPTSAGRYTNSVQRPSTHYRAYNGLNWLRVSVPSNWVEFGSGDNAQFAPEGAYGSQGITRGMLTGIYQSPNDGGTASPQEYVDNILQAQENSYLSQRGSFIRTTVGGRQGYTTTLSGRSPVTNRTEIVTIYTAGLRNGSLFYAVTVVPETESYLYSGAFRTVLNSIRLND